MEFLVNCRSKKKKRFLESILPSIISQLNLQKSKEALVVSVEAECPESGLTVKLPTIGVVVILKASQTVEQLGLTLSHEMVHVRQLAKGYLRDVGDGSKIWINKIYPKDTPYLSQPWELDAFAKQEIIFRRALDE